MLNNKKIIYLSALLLLAVLVLICAPLIGLKTLSLDAALFEQGLDHKIFFQLRLPRTLLAFLAGSGLAVSGMAFQALFRNSLATPFTLGVSSGASLGAAIYVHAGLAFSLLGMSGISLFAFVGALVSILLVYALAASQRHVDSGAMLLSGVAVSIFFSSLILFIQYMSDFTSSFMIVRWLMGGLDVVGFDVPFALFPFMVAGILIVARLCQELNLLSVGEDIAISRGVNVPRLKIWLFFSTSLMVGAIVAACGPIGFVGLMVPHICRLLVKNNHVYLMPATCLLGGTFLVICDTISRTVIAPTEIPVGVITSLLGGPFFLGLLLLKKGGR